MARARAAAGPKRAVCCVYYSRSSSQSAIAYMANGYPERREVLEIVAGILLIGGLGFMGCALETVFGYP
jgi:hypothetical protein